MKASTGVSNLLGIQKVFVGDAFVCFERESYSPIITHGREVPAN
jgi:hypothetical protein